jgi:trimethylamine--corrinoid protein Co-methyltransferase
VLSAEQLERILIAGYRILEEAGLEIRSSAAREVYRRAGAAVDEATQMVRLGRDLVEAQLALAPERFVLHARNGARHLHIGDNVVNFGPVNGAPNIRDLEGGRRYGDLEAFRNILKLTHTLGILHWQGGIVVEPVDVPVATRHSPPTRRTSSTRTSCGPPAASAACRPRTPSPCQRSSMAAGSRTCSRDRRS